MALPLVFTLSLFIHGYIAKAAGLGIIIIKLGIGIDVEATHREL